MAGLAVTEPRDCRDRRDRLRLPSLRGGVVLQVTPVLLVCQGTEDLQGPQASAPRGPPERREFRECLGDQVALEHQELKVSRVGP